jgi:inhibitor of cysteine peptidase
MKRTIILLALLVTGLLLTAGCTGTGTANNSTSTTSSATLKNATVVPANSSMPVITGNSTAITLPVGKTTTIELPENPTTGYAWNVTLSSGLLIENNTYIQDNGTANKVGAGGTHQWVVKGVSTGKQTFSAIYKRPWEALTGNETQFTESITVT